MTTESHESDKPQKADCHPRLVRDLYRDQLDISEQEFSELIDQGKTVLRRIITPQPGRVDLRGMMYDWLDSGSFEALCPFRGKYKVAGLSVDVGRVQVEKHPSLWVFVWVVELQISIANAGVLAQPEEISTNTNDAQS